MRTPLDRSQRKRRFREHKKRHFTSGQAIKWLHINKRILRELIANGKLTPVILLDPRVTYFAREELEPIRRQLLPQKYAT